MANIVEKAEKYLSDLFKEKLDTNFLYHNFIHAQRVLKSVNEIIDSEKLSDKDMIILRLSALFHDTGYIEKRKGHEQVSANIAAEFLQAEKVDDDIIAGVKKCILATEFVREPRDLIEKIICDADSSHFGKKYFNEASEFLRQELIVQNVHDYSPDEWRKENIKVLVEEHQFYTDYAIEEWGPRKKKNLSKLMKEKKKLKKKLKVEQLKAKYKEAAKSDNPERGIQSFYRVALRNHIKLSDIADTKANILLSVNAIIISVVLANLLSKLDTNAFLIIPTAIFVVSSMVTMILAVIATRPNVTRGEFTKEDVENKNVNLTFFGNFHKMELSQFEWAIGELLKDKDYIYSSMTKDLYFLGKVLDRKYRILRITYTIFVVGIIISVLAFGISFSISNNAVETINEVIQQAN